MCVRKSYRYGRTAKNTYDDLFIIGKKHGGRGRTIFKVPKTLGRVVGFTSAYCHGTMVASSGSHEDDWDLGYSIAYFKQEDGSSGYRRYS